MKLNINPVNVYPGINCVVQWQDSLLVVGRGYESVDVYNMHTGRLIVSSSRRIFLRSFCLHGSGNIWIATIGNGMLMMNVASVNNKHIRVTVLPHTFDALSKTEFRAATQEKEGNIWMAGINSGLIKYNAAAVTFMHFTLEQGITTGDDTVVV